MRVVSLAPLLAALLALCQAEPFPGQSSRASESDELKQEPKQTRRLFESGLRLEREGQTAAAIAAFGDLLQQFPNHQNGLRHRAQLLLQSGHSEAASNDLSALLVAHPEDAEAWSTYGDCMRALRRDKDAAGAYLKAIENGLNVAAVNRKRGDALASSGEDNAALESYSSAIKLRLDNPESYFVRGTLLMKMKRERDAIEDFSRAIEFNPDYAEAYFNRGRAWGELGQFANVVRDLSVYLRMKPNDGPALGYRGAAMDSLGRIDEALADYAGALKADPSNSNVLMARAELYSRLARHTDSLADRDRAVALEPLNAYYYMARGGTHLAIGNYEEAISDLTRAVELAPGNARMWYSRAATYLTLGQPGKALNDAVEALRHNPELEAARRLIDEIQASGKLTSAMGSPTSEPQTPQLEPGSKAQHREVTVAALRQPVPTTAIAEAPQAAPTPAPVVPSRPEPAVATPEPSVHREAVAAAPQNPAMPRQVPQAATPARLPAPERLKPLSTPKAAERAATNLKQSPRQLYKEGRELIQQNEFAAGCAKLAQAAALDSTDPLTWNALGYGYMRQREYKEALAAFDKAIALNSRYQNAYENRGAVRRILGDDSGSASDRIQAQLLAKHP